MADFTLGSEYVFNEANSIINGPSSSARLDDTTVVIVYRDIGDSSKIKAQIGVISGTVITWGVEYEVIDSGYPYTVDRLTDTTFVVGYQDSNDNNIKCKIGTVSNDDEIAFGTATSTAWQTQSYCYLVTLDSTHFAITSEPSGNVMIGVVSSGTTITFGSSYSYDVTVGNVALVALSPTEFVVGWADNSNTLTRHGTVASGDEVSYGATNEFDTSGKNPRMIDMGRIASDKFAMSWMQNNDPKDGQSVIGTVSGTTITMGDLVKFIDTESADSPSKVSMTVIDETRLAIAYVDKDMGSDSFIILGTISGLGITYGTPVDFNGGDATYGAAMRLLDSTNRRIFIGFRDVDNSAYGTGIIATYEAGVESPTVTTQAVTSIEKTTATGNGNITDDGGATATRGMCWDTSATPVITDSHATNGTGEGAYTVAMTGLTKGQHYYVRAYATNSEGTSYGAEVEFTAKTDVKVEKSLQYLITKEMEAITKSLKYSVITIPTEKTKSLKYDIFLGLTKIEKGLIYKAVPSIKVEKTLKYCVKQTPTKETKSLKYTTIITPAKLEKSLEYYILTTPSAETKGLIYKVLPSIKIEKGLIYKALPAISITKSLKYTTISTPTAKTSSLKYDIFLGSTKTEKGLIYDVITSTKPTKSLQYEVLAKIKTEKTLKYTIIDTPAKKEKELKYNIFLGTTKIEKGLIYDTKKAIAIEKGLVYGVLPPITINKTLKYTIITTPSQKTKELKYNIFLGTTKIEKSLTYRIIVEGGLQKSLCYKIKAKKLVTKALSFDGIDDYVSIPNLGITGTSFVLESWIKPKPTAIHKTIMGYHSSRRILLGPAPMHLYVVFGGGFSSTGIIQNDVWTHVIYMFDSVANKEYFYINGSYDSEHVPTLTPTWNQAFLIGQYDLTHYLYFGLIDEVRVWDRTLSPTEIKKHFQGVFKNETGLVLNLPMNEGAGCVAYDKSPESNDGQLEPDCPTNSPDWVNSRGLNLSYTIITTPSALTKSLKYNIFIGTFKIEKSLSYDVLTSTKLTKGLVYKALPAIAITKSLKYTVISTPAKTEEELRYDIFLGEVKKEKSLAYYIITTTDINKGLTYKALPSIKIERSLQYNCLPATQIQRTLKYTVITTPTKIEKSLRYDIFLGETAIQKSLKYCCISTPAKTEKSLRYEIFLGATAIQKQLIYKVVPSLAIQKSLKYTIITSVKVEKDLKYTIETTPTGITKSLKYDIFLGETALQESLRYAVRKAIKITKGLIYKALPSTAISKTLKYTIVIAPSAIEKSLKYTIVVAPSALTKALKYCVITTPTKITKSLEYQILTQTKTEKGLVYDVLSEQAITKSLKYCVITIPSAITKSLEYQITTTPSAIEKALHYEILTDTAITKSLKYCIINEGGTTITKELRFEVMTYPYVPFPRTHI